MGKKQSFSKEFRGIAVEEVVKSQRPIVEVARELGILPGTLGNWVSRYRVEHADELQEEELTLSERAHYAELKRENADLRQENAFLGKACSYFAKTSR